LNGLVAFSGAFVDIIDISVCVGFVFFIKTFKRALAILSG
jgi:hypothetical protein